MNKVFALLMVLGLSWSVAQAQTTSESEKPACTQAPEACPPQCYPETEEAKTCLAACKAKASACTPTPKACAAPTACAGATAAAAG
ncbi:MAG TPA: hypothetical protein DCR93_05720, partial [Cytophagales bacterium]|nr:hypothetical protein [Cytophagales bacterium]